ncbi:MAG: putative Ig domain-containing protein [Verrucomicrobiota bacterium]
MNPSKTTIRLLALAAGLLLSQTLPAAENVTFTVTPSVVSNTYDGQITLLVTGLTNGETVGIKQYFDLNTNGVIDAGDWLMQQFNLTDGQAGMVIGGVTNINVPGDTDATPGQITAKLNFQNQKGIQNFIGNYLFELSSTSGTFTAITKSFTVTNLPYGQKFTGSVLSNGTGTAVPNAFIMLTRPGGHGGPVAGAVADDAGRYTIAAPAGSYGIVALGSNYVANFSSPPVVTLPSGQTVTTNVTVISATTSISGAIVDASTTNGNGLGGVMLTPETDSGLLAIAFTEANGTFNVPVTAGQWNVRVEDSALVSRGYLGPNNGTNVPAGTSNILIAVPKATALFYGSVLDNLGNPLPGIDVSDYDNNNLYESDGYTDAGGNYVVAALGGLNNEAWEVSISSDSSPDYDFSQSASQTNGEVVLGADTATLANFTGILSAYTISGYLANGATGAPFASIGIYATTTTNGASYNANADTDSNGFYSLNVFDGSWTLGVNTYCQDCGDSLPGGYFAPSPTALVSNANVTVNLTTFEGTNTITGFLTDNNGTPIPNVGVYANMNGQNYNVNADTDSSGYYSLNVLNGTWNVGINNCRNCGNSDSLPANYLAPQSQTVVITNDNGTANFVAILATNIISGFLTDNNGNPIAGVGVYAYMNNGQNNNPYTDTDATGHYSLNVDNGTWNVGIQNCENCGNNDGLPANYLAPQQQTVVIANDNGTATFVAILATNIISGYVTDINGPIANVQVYAYINGQNGSQNTDTDASGHYSLNVDNGAWNISVNCNNGGNNSLDNILGNGNYACPPTQFATISGNNNATNNFTVQFCGGVSISTSLPAGEVGVYYDQFLQASSCNSSYTWSLSGQTDGLSWNNYNGEIYGTPSGSGAFPLIAQVTDGDGHHTNQSLSLTIEAAVQVTTSSLPNDNNGAAYSQQLKAGGGLPPYTWALAPFSAEVPPNMSLSPAGVLSGTPTNSTTFSFTVLVADSLGGTAEQSLSLTVVTVTNLQITTTSLPAATENVPYTNTLAVSGGHPPYTWSLATGSALPGGLTLSTNGLLSGAPTNIGVASFTVQVTDASKARTNQLLTLTVNPQLGSLQVTISPLAAATNGAYWQLDANSALYNSGATVSNIVVGIHSVRFSAIPGWITPSNQSVTITANQTANVTGAYVPIPPTGALQVTITPPQAVSAGAEWQLNGGAFRVSGAIVTNLATNIVVISFKAIAGFVTPPNQTNLIIGGQTNTLTGLYLSTNNPTLSIVSPKAGQDVTYPAFTVTGTARDNVAVAEVYVQLNGGVWTNAFSTNGFANWTANVTLTPGTNTVRAYAVNTSTNASPTTNINFFYAVPAPLAVQIVGNGTVSPYTNNQLLNIGQNYTEKAAAATGFKFTNWTGSFPGSSSNLTFLMASNLTLIANIANFVDVTPPSLAITSPTANQRWSNSIITVTGTARDNVQVASVLCQLNGTGWQQARTLNGWTNWSNNMAPAPGPNTLQAYAVDTSGNNSPTNTVKFLYIPSATLTVLTGGNGAFTPNDNGAWLAIGTNYTLTAVPGKNWIFSNWVGGTTLPYPVLSVSSNFTFAMQSNLVLQANFVTNVFLAAQGTYNGLFTPTNAPRRQTNSGAITLTVTSAGVLSGKLTIGANTPSLSGQFTPAGAATIVTPRKGQSNLTTALQLDFAGQTVSGSVTDGSFVAQVVADLAVFNSTNKATNYEGQYTFIIPGTNEPAAGPLGTSCGTVTVSPLGAVTFSVSLADGTASPVNPSGVISGEGYWPFYLPLYGGNGSLWSWNFFANGAMMSAPGASWINTTNTTAAALYRAGFTNEAVSMIGSAYTTNEPLLALTNGQVVLEGGNLPVAITNQFILTSKNTILLTNAADTNKLTLTITKTNGVISGAFANPSHPSQTISVSGVLLQNQTNAQGYFLGTNASGAFLLAPQ